MLRCKPRSSVGCKIRHKQVRFHAPQNISLVILVDILLIQCEILAQTRYFTNLDGIFCFRSLEISKLRNFEGKILRYVAKVELSEKNLILSPVSSSCFILNVFVSSACGNN